MCQECSLGAAVTVTNKLVKLVQQDSCAAGAAQTKQVTPSACPRTCSLQVTHIDDGAINALTKFYSEVFPASGQKDVALLDICSSWISHYPQGYTAGRIAGGAAEEEEEEKKGEEGCKGCRWRAG